MATNNKRSLSEKLNFSKKKLENKIIYKDVEMY